MSHNLNYFGQPIGFSLANWQAPPLPTHKILEGMHCKLEPLDSEKHASDLFEAHRVDYTGESWTYMSYKPFNSVYEYREWAKSRASETGQLFYAIIDKRFGNAAGIASYLRMLPTFGSIEVGHIHLSPMLQRTIAATEAMYLMMRNVFDLGYRRYEWKCDALNTRSRWAASRLGFSYEGIFRQAAIYKGRNRDTAWYSVIDTEWPALRTMLELWLRPDNFNAAGKQLVALSDLTRRLVRNRFTQSGDSSGATGNDWLQLVSTPTE